MNIDISIIRSSFSLLFVFVHTNMHRINIISIKIGLCFTFFVFNEIFQVSQFLHISSKHTRTHMHTVRLICASQYLIWWTIFIKNYPWWDTFRRRYAIKVSITRSNLAMKDQHIACNEVDKDRTSDESFAMSRFPSSHTFTTNNILFFIY